MKSATKLAHVSQVAAVIALAASIAHEVSQPLSGLVVNSNTCLRMLDADPPDIGGARETIRRTLRDVKRASEVITRLRATFGERDFTRLPLDMNDTIREVILLSSNDLRRGGITVGSTLAADLPQVLGDRSQVQLVIINLLRNARDAMLDVRDRARSLFIKTEREADNAVRVTVRDTGVALFSRAEGLFSAAYVEGGDVGIGLFVSRSIIERHQGRLWAERNETGPGTTLSFSIPSAERS